MTSIDHDNNDEEDNDHHEEEEEEEEDIVLPGYDAGVNESGVKHSQLKLKESAKRLSLKLLEIIDQNCNQNNDHEEEEGVDGDGENENEHSSSSRTTTQTIGIQTFSCLNEEETLTYRCRCNFQIVQIPAIIPVTTTASSSLSLLLSSSSSSFRYALRSKGQPVLLGTKNSFPIATRRIQSAMKEFMDYINNNNNNNENENNNENNSNNTIITTRTSSIANKYLTSCTFSSAWNDLPDADCVLTLNYDQQYLDLDNNDNENESGKGNNKNKIAWRWKQEAQLLCQQLHLRQINGRSKGTLLSVREGWGEGKEGDKNNNSSHGCNDGDNANDKSDEKEATIRDTVYLLRSDSCNNDNDNDKTSTMKVKWNVSLEGQQQQRPTGGSVTTEIDRGNDDNHNNNDDNDDANNKSTIITTTIFPIHYEKPETAFYHPNPNAMTKALAWMLDRLTCISISKQQDANNDSKLKLLEMYCGCGAHTVALGRSGLISQILAIELDPRLVRSCEKNISLNGLQNLIRVYRGDAGRWSKEESRRRRRRNRQRSRAFVETANSDSRMRNNNNDDDDNGSCNYDVLLVDPPRQGVDEEVCRMAMMTMSDDDDNNNDDNKVHGTSSGDDNNNNSSHGSGGCFQNILCVSCGHQALLRDLERLSPVYEVVNCAQMDLFPRTDSIETLVHLRNRTMTST